jgi:hypothetical protein
MTDQTMAKKEIPTLVCTPITLDFPTMDRTNIVCFESHITDLVFLQANQIPCFHSELSGMRAGPSTSKRYCSAQLL